MSARCVVGVRCVIVPRPFRATVARGEGKGIALHKTWKSYAAMYAGTAMLVLAVGLVSVLPASAVPSRPLKGSGTSSAALDPITNNLNATSHDVTSVLGKATATITGNLLNPVGTTVTSTTANGATLTSQVVNVLAPTVTCTPVSGSLGAVAFKDDLTITGGTGRLAGASGSYTTEGCSDIVPDANSPTGLTIVSSYTINGTISF